MTLWNGAVFHEESYIFKYEFKTSVCDKLLENLSGILSTTHEDLKETIKTSNHKLSYSEDIDSYRVNDQSYHLAFLTNGIVTPIANEKIELEFTKVVIKDDYLTVNVKIIGSYDKRPPKYWYPNGDKYLDFDTDMGQYKSEFNKLYSDIRILYTKTLDSLMKEQIESVCKTK